MEDIKLFLHHVSVPAEARVTIIARVAEGTWEPDVEGVLLAILPQNYHTTLPMVAQTGAMQLFAGHTSEGTLTFKGGFDPDSEQRQPSWVFVLLDCGERLSESLHTAMLELPQVVPPTDLVHLELHVAPHVLLLDLDWKAFLERLPRLRKLTVGSLWKAEGVVRALYWQQNLLPELKELELCLESLPAKRAGEALPPPEGGPPARIIERVIIMQADDAPDPFFEGSLIGSMLHALHYEFRHSQCSACHITGRVLPGVEHSQDERAIT
ncbi:hypothetical protein BD413DRAFT_612178 [Trametes elegans]|nr:hypothetical protein BD413DRAFT_612178 [Trametes elegans]